ncbi:M91 family zinc metallopeptidase [Actinokineospora sp. HUAS TT18]|uniref:M91 family zinc metallopeptidase n=1 Tax=Actinokineospora sp. HUAS TT18 TaxID=3447451 RepID=UPI003F52559C
MRYGVVVSALLAMMWWTAQPAVADSATAGFAGSAGSSTYQPGEPITLRWTLTNSGATACKAASEAEAVVTIGAVTRDGTPLARNLSAPLFDGVPGDSPLTELAPGASVELVDESTETLRSVSRGPVRGQDVVSSWTLAEPGSYEVTATYALPTPVADGCAGATATVRFTIGAPAGKGIEPWMWAVGAGVIVLAIVVFLLVRGRRKAAAALILLAVTGSLTVSPGRSAQASIEIIDVVGQTAFRDAVNGCLNTFNSGHDPMGIMPGLYANPHMITISKTTGTSGAEKKHSLQEKPPGVADDVKITWNPTNRDVYYGDDVARDPCAALYHELHHAVAMSQGGQPDIDSMKVCGDESGMAYTEYLAVKAENAYRAGAPTKLPARKSYTAYNRSRTVSMKEAEQACKNPQPPAKPKTVSKANECVKVCAKSRNDPHLVTFDGHHYDFQAVGEFDAVIAGDLRVQTRQGGNGVPNVSVDTAAAMSVAGDRLAFYATGGALTVRLDGKPFVLDKETRLPRGGVVRPSAEDFEVSWPDGSRVWVEPLGGNALNVTVSLAAARRPSGLFGDTDGSQANDLTTRQGVVLTDPPFDKLYKEFGDSWRITQAESLFDYAPGESTTTFTDRAFPAKAATAADLPNRPQAEAVCAAGGVRDPRLLAECALDVGMTGLAPFLASAAAEQSGLDTTDQSGALRDGDTVTADRPWTGAGRIGAPGEKDVFRLDLAGATWFSLLDVTGSVEIKLTGPGAASPLLPGDHQYGVLPGGEYQLEVTGSGDYGFRLVTLKPRNLTAKVGGEVSGTLDVPGRVELVKIDPAGAERLMVTGTPCEDVTFGVVPDSPTPRVFTPYELCWEVPTSRLEDGAHVIVLWSESAKTGAYRFTAEGA